MADEALLPDQSTVSPINLPRTRTLWSVINRAVDLCYQGLKQRWVLLLTAAVVGSLLAGALWLPQLPGQLNSDPTAAARWLLGMSSSYGALGGLLRLLGMFDALHSPLLQLSLAILVLILSIYLSDSLVIAWRFYRLPNLMASKPQEIGSPVETALPVAIYRQREAAPLIPEQLYEQLRGYLHNRFSQVKENRLTLPKESAWDKEETAAGSESGLEWRFLATRHALWLYLRPVGILGALLALSALWWIVLAGWWIEPPLLAPGDLYRYTQHDLELNYVAPTPEATPQLSARIGADQAQQEITKATNIGVGAVDIIVKPGPPALLVRVSQGEATLERAGQSKVAPWLGLVFPSTRHEESILLPKQRVGLRIVRIAEAPPLGTLSGFQVELWEQDAKPEQIKMSDAQRQTLPIDKQVTLELTLLPSLAVTVSYLPGQWLLWLALLLCAIGSVGFIRRPVFLLIQIGPWPDLRSVVVVQSNVPQELAQLQDFLSLTQ